MPVAVVVLDEEGVRGLDGVRELVVERVAKGEALGVVEGVPSADPETVSVAEGVANGDADPDPVLDCEPVEDKVTEAVKEGVAKGLCVCVSKEEVVPDLDLVPLGV